MRVCVPSVGASQAELGLGLVIRRCTDDDIIRSIEIISLLVDGCERNLYQEHME